MDIKSFAIHRLPRIIDRIVLMVFIFGILYLLITLLTPFYIFNRWINDFVLCLLPIIVLYFFFRFAFSKIKDAKHYLSIILAIICTPIIILFELFMYPIITSMPDEIIYKSSKYEVRYQYGILLTNTGMIVVDKSFGILRERICGVPSLAPETRIKSDKDVVKYLNEHKSE